MAQSNSNTELVDFLVEDDRIRSDRVEDAFRRIDRREFIPSEHSSYAYADKPIPIGGVTVSAPHIVAEVTELLELEGSETVLEIGSGSGYQGAILGELAQKVVGVEIDQRLAEDSREKVPDNVEIIRGNGFKAIDGKSETGDSFSASRNSKEFRNFDRILFSCAAENFDEAAKHIKEDGIIVGPVIEGGRQVLKKWKNGKITEHGGVRYVEMED